MEVTHTCKLLQLSVWKDGELCGPFHLGDLVQLYTEELVDGHAVLTMYLGRPEKQGFRLAAAAREGRNINPATVPLEGHPLAYL